MMRNNVSGAGTRHINTRIHLVRELHDDIIMYVQGRWGNESDLMTKHPLLLSLRNTVQRCAVRCLRSCWKRSKKRRMLKCVEFRTLIVKDVRRMDNGGC